MSLNIQTATGLLEIGGNVTKEKVISALGYEPADKAHTTDKTVHVTSAEKETWNAKADQADLDAFKSEINESIQSDSDNLIIADESGNIIMQVDADGLATTNVNAKTIELNGEDLGTRLDELESVSLPNILDNESGDLTITDESGNVIMKVDSDGLETTTVTAKSAIINGVDITTYVDTQVANLVNSAPEALNTLDELAAALGDDENFATTVTNQIASKVDQIVFDAHTHTKADVGLDNVDNTADINKPVSTAQQEALDSLKTELSESIVSESKEWVVADEDGNIIAKVDENGLETTTVTANAVVINGTDIKTALDSKSDDGHTHDQYLEADDISGLATTEYVNSQIKSHTTNQANPHNVTATQIGLGNVDNTSDTNKPVSIAQQTALDNLKSELSESIVSESTEWTIADNSGNIVAKVDANGLETTTVTAKAVVLNSTDLGNILDTYILNIDYSQLAFDTTEIV